MPDLLSPFLVRAYVAVALMAVISLSGSVAVLRGIAYMPAEAAHAALGGAALGVLISYATSLPLDPFLMAIVFAGATALFAGYVGRRGGPEAMAAALAGALALGVSIYAFIRFILPAKLRIVLDGYLVGDILLLREADFIGLLALIVAGVAVLAVFYNEIIYVCFDPEGMEAMGINAARYDYVLFLLIGLAGGVATKTVGSLIVFALVIAPAITAKELSSTVKGLLAMTFAITLAAGYGGLAISLAFNLPSGGSIAIIASTIYAATILAKRLVLK